MPDTVPVTLELDPENAAALENPATRARVERLIRRTARPAGVERLFAAMHALGRGGATRPHRRDPPTGARRLQRRAPGTAADCVIVVDASTLVGAVIRLRSIPDQVVHHAFEADEVAVSVAMLAELAHVLARPRLGPRARLGDVKWLSRRKPSSDF